MQGGILIGNGPDSRCQNGSESPDEPLPVVGLYQDLDCQVVQRGGFET